MHYTPHATHHTSQSTLRTVHFALHTMRSTLRTSHITPLDCAIMCYHSRVMYYHSIPLDCWLLTVGPTFKHAWAAAFFHAREELWCHEQPPVKSAREQHSRTRLWVLLPERRNEQGCASSTAVRVTGVQRGVAKAGSGAVRSSSLLLSATLPKCRHSNPACTRSPGLREGDLNMPKWAWAERQRCQMGPKRATRASPVP